jgi:hypothetical protein
MRQLRSLSLFRHRFVSLIAVLLTVAGVVQAQNAAKPVRLIVRPIENNRTVTLKGNVHPLATPANDHGLAPESLPVERMVLLLNRSAAQQHALLKMSDDLQNSKSPSYHKWLTPVQFGARFGLGDDDLAAVTSWLQSGGFKIEEVSPSRNFITFSGTHTQLKTAFHTELHQYVVEGSPYWANASDPQIPAALAPVIQGFASLNNFPVHPQHTPQKLARRRASTGKRELVRAAGKPKPNYTLSDGFGDFFFGIGPADFATIYNVQPLYDAGFDGTGQTIAVVEDSDLNPADVDYFRSVFGLPAKKLNLIYNGPNPGLTGDEGEADIDVEWAGAVAPGATIDMVASANTTVSQGVFLASMYVVQNNLAPIMSVSFGECELVLGTSGNAFLNELWRQAAAQGITVMVSSGDSGSALCNVGGQTATVGLTVSGIASTPYNVAVGGTDLYGTVTNPTAYWGTISNPTTLESALSYMPETPWNDSCTNPQALPFLQAEGLNDPTTEAVCNDLGVQAELLVVQGGSGGASSCTVSAPLNSPDARDPASCTVGYAKPSWQSGVPGIPVDGARDLPDISLMAGAGFYGTGYVFCQSDATVSTTACDVINEAQVAGGTSFAAPNFAGMLALVEQQTQSRQGNINYILYKLGTTEFANNDTLAQACQSGNVTPGNACTFYDVALGTNAMPCDSGSANCLTQTNGDLFGILSGYNAVAGYDQATGIGTVNAYNMVQNWNSVTSNFLSSLTTLSATGGTAIPYGATLGVNVAVAAAAPATGTPSGDVAILGNSSVPGQQSFANAPLINGQAAITLQQLPVGSYQLSVHYAGDATFAASTSNGVAITVAQAATTASLSASRTTILPGQQVGLFLTVSAQGSGVNPTGTVTVTDTTTGQTLGTGPVAGVAAGGWPTGNGFITVPSGMLSTGTHTIVASYSGDGNYLPSTASSIAVTVAQPFAVGLNPASIDIKAGSTSGNTLTILATPNGNSLLNAGTLSFACQGTLPAGLACAFSTPVAQADGSVASKLTLQLISPLLVKSFASSAKGNSSTPANAPVRYGIPGASAILLLLLARRRRRLASYLGVLALLVAPGLMLSGCGGAGKTAAPTPASPLATMTAMQASSLTPALNSAVTFNATVASTSGGTTPTGSVAFMSGSTTLATVPLANGAASYSTSSLPIGSQSIVAQYAGDTTHSASTSLSTTVDVTYSTNLTVTVQDNAGHTGSANLAVTVD